MLHGILVSVGSMVLYTCVVHISHVFRSQSIRTCSLSDPDVHADNTPTMEALLQEVIWDTKALCEGIAELHIPHKEL